MGNLGAQAFSSVVVLQWLKNAADTTTAPFLITTHGKYLRPCHPDPTATN
jgi:hypothetical protein